LGDFYLLPKETVLNSKSLTEIGRFCSAIDNFAIEWGNEIHSWWEDMNNKKQVN
jgi:hypothetical protein